MLSGTALREQCFLDDHQVGQGEQGAQLRGVLGEAAIAHPDKAHPSLQRGEHPFDLSPDLADQRVVALLRGSQLWAAAPTPVHDARFDAEAGKPVPPRTHLILDRAQSFGR